MRLITLNILGCNVKSCAKDNFPLDVHVKKSEVRDGEFSAEKIKGVLEKIDSKALEYSLASVYFIQCSTITP